MKPSDVVHSVAGWLSGADDEKGIVVSCRARLARNLAGVPFGARASHDDRRTVVDQVLQAARYSERMRGAVYFDLSLLDPAERRLLVERHLISPALAEAEGQRGVLFNPDESLSVMVNEEDHLRLQAILPGLRAEEAWDQVSAVDDELGAALGFAHSRKWGYLTACPTNTGTGLRVSVLMHLPGLVLTEQIEKVLRGLTQMSCAVRGLYGEGSNALGNLFQVSNQTTLGIPEPQVVTELLRVVRLLIGCEREAEGVLMSEARSQVEDKVWRAFGLLSHARVLSSQEFMNLLSAVRLGYSLSLIDELPTGFMNHLMLVTQPSHLQIEAGRELTAEERDVRRAALVRQRIAGLKPGS
ncbi:MAG: protein arginine kinase [Candidatus Latescibacterota bacterium]|jgi:protein arginine kinase